MSLTDSIAGWLRDQVNDAGANGAVVALSGGIDSATVAGLAARGLGADKVLGVMLPAHSQPADLEHAKLVARSFGLETLTIDLSEAVDLFKRILPPGTELATANIKPRLRMLTLYYVANTRGSLVIGTGNRSELMVGYFTKYGDGGVDLLPLAGLYKRDVRQLAREIGVPEPIIEKPPSAGLWAGQTDEEEMGISYEELDGILSALDHGDVSAYPDERVAKVQRMIAGSAHKRGLAPIFEPGQEQKTEQGR